MYNRREIMTAAWRKVRRFGLTLSAALRMAWYEAKEAASRWDVYGFRIYDDSRVRLAAGVTADQAAQLKWQMHCRYDDIHIVPAA